MRHPDRRESDVIICIRKIEVIFKECEVDLISLEGIELPEKWGHKTGADLYYYREIQVQNIVLTAFSDRIEHDIKCLTESSREREREVLKTWIAILWKRDPSDPRTINIQLESFAHFYQLEFNREMPVYIDAAMITDTLARARLAYPVDGTLCPMWYTGRNWLAGQRDLLGER